MKNVLSTETMLIEKVRAQLAVDEFMSTNPSVMDIQTYIDMARSDLRINKHDLYAQEIINLLADD